MNRVPYTKAQIDAARKAPYVYNATFATGVTHGTSVLVNVATDADAAFQVQVLTRAVITALDAPINQDILMGQQYPALSVTVYDNTNGCYLMNQATPMVNLFGSAQYPSIVPGMYTVLPQSTLTVTLTNNYTALDIAWAQLSFIGRKVYV